MVFFPITLNAATPCCAIIVTSLNAVKNVFPKIVYWFNIKSQWNISWNKLFIVQCIFLIIFHFYACTVLFTKIILHTMLWTLDGLKWLDRTAVVNLDWKRTKHINHKLNILKFDLYSSGKKSGLLIINSVSEYLTILKYIIFNINYAFG